MTRAEVVAADTNLIRHPTPRRYLTALEGLRGRGVAILPMVDREVLGQLPNQAADHVRKLCKRNRIGRVEAIDAAARAASGAAAQWWEKERFRNSSAYALLPDLGDPHYRCVSADLPGAAFTDSNDSDRTIYAQAWTHGIDVLTSRNRRTILKTVLEEHFAERGHPAPPVKVRGLFEHTRAVAGHEGRPVTDVAFEAVLGAVIPNAWTPGASDPVLRSCMAFTDGLAISEGRRVSVMPEENELVHILNRAIEEIDREDFAKRCEEAHARRPRAARETETRYHDRVRTAVRETGIDLWG